MEKRITDRKLLASFIEYAAVDKVSTAEWQRFIVEHYSDPIMENARSECARIVGGYAQDSKNTKENREALYNLAKDLRNAT